MVHRWRHRNPVAAGRGDYRRCAGRTRMNPTRSKYFHSSIVRHRRRRRLCLMAATRRVGGCRQRCRRGRRGGRGRSVRSVCGVSVPRSLWTLAATTLHPLSFPLRPPPGRLLQPLVAPLPLLSRLHPTPLLHLLHTINDHLIMPPSSCSPLSLPLLLPLGSTAQPRIAPRQPLMLAQILQRLKLIHTLLTFRCRRRLESHRF